MYCRKIKKPFPPLTQVRAPYFMISYIKKIYYRNFDRKKLRNLFSFITAYAKKIWNLWRSFTLREKCPYSKFSWHVFSRIWNEYGEILPISPYSVQMRVITDQRKLLLHSVTEKRINLTEYQILKMLFKRCCKCKFCNCGKL